MKAYFSFWQGGWRGRGLNINQELFDMQKISLFLAKKHFKEVHFLTDSYNAEKFKQFNFNSIEVIFDDINYENGNLWSISKLFAFKNICKKGDSFIHMDYDVFLWGDLPQRLRQAEVFGQCKEDNSYKWYGVESFLKHCPAPGIIGKVNPKPRDAINMGIFGGNNLEFINKYSQEALSIALDKQNQDFFNTKNLYVSDWNRTCTVEQYTLSVCCQEYQVEPKFLFEYWPKKEQTKKQKYTHLMGTKNNPDIIEKIKKIAAKIP
jgi:hypothetical protein